MVNPETSSKTAAAPAAHPDVTTETSSRRSGLRLALDVVMAVTFALLLNVHVLGGLRFHETAGTLVGVAFALHLYLNWSWVTQVTARFVQATLPPRTRVGYLLNGTLLLAMGFIIGSGLLISRVLVPGWRVANGRGIQAAHITVAFLVLGVVGVHVGLHWSWLLAVGRRLSSAVGSLGLAWARHGLSRFIVAGVGVILAVGLVVSWTRDVPPPDGPEKVASTAPSNLRPDPDARPSLDPSPGAGVPDDGRRRSEGPQEGRRHDARGRGRGFRFARATPWGVAGFYLGLMGLFVVATVQVERWMNRRRSPARPSSSVPQG